MIHYILLKKHITLTLNDKGMINIKTRGETYDYQQIGFVYNDNNNYSYGKQIIRFYDKLLY